MTVASATRTEISSDIGGRSRRVDYGSKLGRIALGRTS
jgi:hypothetical protein